MAALPFQRHRLPTVQSHGRYGGWPRCLSYRQPLPCPAAEAFELFVHNVKNNVINKIIFDVEYDVVNDVNQGG